MVTFEDGKIVCVQKAVKEGQKSTKVRGNLMIIGTLVIMIMIMTIMTKFSISSKLKTHSSH